MYDGYIVSLIKLPPCIVIVHLIDKIFRANSLYSVSQAARGPDLLNHFNDTYIRNA